MSDPKLTPFVNKFFKYVMHFEWTNVGISEENITVN